MTQTTPFRVMEIFPTIQGEGSDIGRETIFMRLYGCNLKCVWCDTAHSWDESKYFEGVWKGYSLDDIIDEVTSLAVPQGITHMVITGGEPLLHNHELLSHLIRKLKVVGIRHVTFETNGTIIPSEELISLTGLFSVSPKLQSSGNPPYKARLLDRWAKAAYEKVQFKFVLADIHDAVEVAEMLQEMPDTFRFMAPIIFQPEESANNYKQLPEVVGEAFDRVGLNKSQWNIRYIPQVHKLYQIR